MKTYQINEKTILIEKIDELYVFWNMNTIFLVVIDIFKVEKNQPIYHKTLFSPYKIMPSQMISVRNFYNSREKYPKIKIEQLLTHENDEVRETVKGIIDGSI